MIEIQLWLYGKPSWDMPIEGVTSITPNMLRKRAKELYKHLLAVADLFEKLSKEGWNVSGSIYSLTFYKDKTVTKKDVLTLLKKVHIKEQYKVVTESDD